MSGRWVCARCGHLRTAHSYSWSVCIWIPMWLDDDSEDDEEPAS